jgi:hypothetical protein
LIPLVMKTTLSSGINSLFGELDIFLTNQIFLWAKIKESYSAFIRKPISI